MAPTQYLFVQTAADAHIMDQSEEQKQADLGEHTLLLTGVERTIYFSDRPMRVADSMTNAEFLKKFWTQGEKSFAVDPPNAELVFFRGQQNLEAVTVVLSSPLAEGDNLSYTVAAVGTGKLPAAGGCSAALFIDDANPPGFGPAYPTSTAHPTLNINTEAGLAGWYEAEIHLDLNETPWDAQSWGIGPSFRGWFYKKDQKHT